MPDGALLCFYSTDPKYSYLMYGMDGRVAYTAEKRVVSQDAICGAYLFGSKTLFTEYAQRYLELCEYDEYFVSGVYNVMAEDDLNVRGYPVDCHIPFGTPGEYHTAQEDDRSGEWLP